MEEVKTKRYANAVFSFTEEQVLCLLYSIGHTQNHLILSDDEKKIYLKLQEKLWEGAKMISRIQNYDAK